MKLRRLLYLVGALVLALSLVACDGDSGGGGDQDVAAGEDTGNVDLPDAGGQEDTGTDKPDVKVVCDPACGEGFICVDGICELICDPPCGDDLVCNEETRECEEPCDGACTGDTRCDLATDQCVPICDPVCEEGFYCDHATATCISVCGECDAGYACDAVSEECVPVCDPPCDAGYACVEPNVCSIEDCDRQCDGRECGDDGCGGTCGACADGFECNAAGTCFDPNDCPAAAEANCAGLECGSDGCGGTCGECADGDACLFGMCCTPACDGRECGSDGCGGLCGTCPDGGSCTDGVCCVPACDGKVCGSDGCGGSCGSCGSDEVCSEDGSQCIPDTPGLTCTEWYACANACPPGPNQAQCIVECDTAATPSELAKKNALEACRDQRCAYCMDDPDPNGCYSTCTNEQCGDEFMDCLASSFCDPSERDDCLDCGGIISCQNGCVDDQGNFDQECYFACEDLATGDGYMKLQGLMNCLQTACPTGSPDNCWSEAQQSGGACYDALQACVGPADFCDPATEEGCIGCGGFIGCQNECVDDAGNYDEACGDACFDLITQTGYEELMALYDCLYTECPEGSPDSCWSEVQAAGGACEGVLQDCSSPDDLCDPDVRDDCLGCGAFIQCQNECVDDEGNYDEVCGDACMALITQEGYAALIGLYDCLYTACPEGSPDSCWGEAQGPGGACEQALADCAGGGPAEYCDPTVQDDCLGCGDFIQCQNGCVDDAGNYDEACGDACMELITEEGYNQLIALYECLYEACPDGSPDSCWGEAQGPGGACEQALTDCAGGSTPGEYCDPTAQDDCLGCGDFIQCQNGCVDDAGNYDEACGDACMELITEEGYNQLIALYECLYEACPDGSPDTCWGEAQGPGGACEQALTDCAGGSTPGEYCDPTIQDDCLGCGAFIQCQNGCVDDAGNYDEACGDACMELITEEGYNQLVALYDCLYQACPDGSPDTCWGEAQGPGGACEQALTDCAGGAGPGDYCDPTMQDDCLGCGAFIQCQNGCVDDAGNYDEACGDACMALITEEGYDQLVALYDCLYEACPDGSPDTCWGEAQGPGGACEQALTDCAGGGGPVEYCDPTMQDDCLGCGEFIQCQNGCVDDAGNYDEVCADACMALITEEGYGQVVALYECLYEACPEGSPDTCWSEAQAAGGACEQALIDCAGTAPAEYCDPTMQDDCLGCGAFIQCQNGCTDDAGNYDEACGDACLALLTEEGYLAVTALYECLYEACPEGSPDACWSEAQSEGGACEQQLIDCAGEMVYCDPAVQDDCLGCGEFILCQNGCVDDAGNYDEACGDACLAQITEEGFNAVQALYACLETACPEGSADTCWSEAQADGGACEAELRVCGGGPAEFCDPLASLECLDCAGFVACQNGCMDEMGNADQACLDACAAAATEDGYELYAELISCLLDACPMGSDETCWGDAQAPGGACGDFSMQCAGGPTEACDPAVSETCIECADLATCLEGCEADEACLDACWPTATSGAQQAFWALQSCLFEACPIGEMGQDEACLAAALGVDGACMDEGYDCYGMPGKSTFAAPLPMSILPVDLSRAALKAFGDEVTLRAETERVETSAQQLLR